MVKRNKYLFNKGKTLLRRQMRKEYLWNNSLDITDIRHFITLAVAEISIILDSL